MSVNIKNNNKKLNNSAGKKNSPQVKLEKIAVYVFCPNLDVREAKRPTEYLFKEGVPDLQQRISDQPIFLDVDSALQYARFMGENHVVLKAYVDESAVAGHSHHKLIIRENSINHDQIHGCYISAHDSNAYHENPHFDDEHLPE